MGQACGDGSNRNQNSKLTLCVEYDPSTTDSMFMNVAHRDISKPYRTNDSSKPMGLSTLMSMVYGHKMISARDSTRALRSNTSEDIRLLSPGNMTFPDSSCPSLNRRNEREDAVDGHKAHQADQSR